MNEVTVNELKAFLISQEIAFSPYFQAEVDQKKEELGGLPRLLEEYYLKIGWFDDISASGMGCYIYPLEELQIKTAQELVAARHCNEVDDYLSFGGEAISVDLFAIKMKDINQDNASVYGYGESYQSAEGLAYMVAYDAPTLSHYFDLVQQSLLEL
ncbi:hypothetical protein [Isobaculum melis]|uniref:SMI1 / KNR4 family (SUKH-1) n=1 Tax=Isobaculum melis TaxID=142588 RepID=A0A1H9QTK0_9LACT|nr:hypothetical protein [Isobaculum melis]SER63941.1 hypothetical protein SAMN04488559_102285 [Isobaculum melis]